MNPYLTPTFVDNTSEVLKLYKSGNWYQSRKHEATIIRKPNGEFEVQGAFLVYNEPKEVWIGQRRRHYRKLQILTPSENVVEFERHGTRDYRMITPGYELGAVNWVQF